MLQTPIMKLLSKFPSQYLIQLASVIVLVMLQVLQQPPSIVALLGYTREDFPSDFVFGSGTSAYQVEGAAFEDGRTPSVLDMLAHAGAYGGDAADVGCDEYHKYKEDVQLMVDVGLDAYRFSISWSRLIPNGRGPINPKGVEYYNNLINELINNGIQPHVTLQHFDLPQALADAYGGWQNKQIVEDFTAFAEVCFKEFGDRVLYWSTINEPNLLPHVWYNKAAYVAGHNILLAHASVVKLYKEKYQASQHGSMGITIHTFWYIPKTNTQSDIIATERVREFLINWLIHPLVFGEYPDRMRQFLGSRLPSFTEHEATLVKGSIDFIGVNCYYAMTVEDDPSSEFSLCMGAKCTYIDVGGELMQGILEHFKQNYGNPPIYIHENGFSTFRNASMHDTARIDHLNASIGSLLDAVRNGSNVRGYFQWSFMDVFEFLGGFEIGYGLYYVDLDSSDLKRYPKLSAHWYSAFLKREKFVDGEIIRQIGNSTDQNNRNTSTHQL